VAEARELVVGVATHQDAAVVAPVARAVAEGIIRTGRPACLIVADGGSTDGTVKTVEAAADGMVEVAATTFARPPADPLRAPYHGLPGRHAAIRAVLRAALEREAVACVFLDGRLTSVTPDWIVRLAEPPLGGEFDYAAPRYARSLFEGALTRSVVYPTFRALYGCRLRQPAAGEFGCSARFIQHVLNEPFWESDGASIGVDLWLASSAAAGRLRMCEAALGVRTHAATADAPDLTTTVTQVIGALFADMEARVDAWQRIRSSSPLPSFGSPAPLAPPQPAVDVEPMFEAFRLAHRALREVWASVLPPRTILQLRKTAETPSAQARVPDELWAEIVYDFALAFHARVLPRDHLLGAFTPLYQGWLAAYITEVRSGGANDPDERLERLCLTFETKKPHLIAGWRWPARFRA
jgi:hypothetical protein